MKNKKTKVEKKAHSRSVETLHHFSCGKCKKWWSIGDAPKEKTEWFCPWCGEGNTYEQ
jgi:PHP family Zn ribbon phosphoesterase